MGLMTGPQAPGGGSCLGVGRPERSRIPDQSSFRAVLLLALGFRLWSGFGLGLRNWLEVEEDLVLEMWGEQCRARLLLPGRWGRPRGSRGASGRRIRGCGFGLAVAL